MLTAINVKSRERERGGKKEGNLDTCRTKKLRRQSKILTPSLGARGGGWGRGRESKEFGSEAVRRKKRGKGENVEEKRLQS